MLFFIMTINIYIRNNYKYIDTAKALKRADKCHIQKI